jgi:hypothetical protein
MPVVDLPGEKIRLLAAKDENHFIDHDFGGPAGWMGKVWPRSPHIGCRIVDVHACNAVGIAAANRPFPLPDANPRPGYRSGPDPSVRAHQ